MVDIAKTLDLLNKVKDFIEKNLEKMSDSDVIGLGMTIDAINEIVVCEGEKRGIISVHDDDFIEEDEDEEMTLSERIDGLKL